MPMRFRLARAALMLCAILALPVAANASADPKAVAVLNAESRWLHAIASRNVKALSGILAENFVHTTYRGAVRYREAELAAVKQPKPYGQRTGEQTVDIIGNAAIVHGVNTITQSGQVVMRLRYTDVFALQRGTWRAVSAQETAIATR